jgi:hypothetical protein
MLPYNCSHAYTIEARSTTNVVMRREIQIPQMLKTDHQTNLPDKYFKQLAKWVLKFSILYTQDWKSFQSLIRERWTCKTYSKLNDLWSILWNTVSVHTGLWNTFSVHTWLWNTFLFHAWQWNTFLYPYMTMEHFLFHTWLWNTFSVH